MGIRFKIDLCYWYDVKHEGLQSKPICHMGHKASLKCHSPRIDCPDYRAEVIGNEAVEKESPHAEG